MLRLTNPSSSTKSFSNLKIRVCSIDNMISLLCGGRVLLLLAALVVFSFLTVDCDGGDGGEPDVRWQILTKLNYTSQIRLHPHLLLLVTVPWSGESRSLMKDLAHAITRDEKQFGTLKLMVLHRNAERMLADALGASDGITILYHRNTHAYKYSGRLRVQNILSSMHYAMSLSSDALPLKSLTNPEELGDFLRSTDKAVLLLDFCGWTPRLLATNKITAGSSPGKVYLGANSNNGSTFFEEKDNRKVIEDGRPICSIDNGFSGPFYQSQFTSVNDSLKDTGNWTSGSGDSCTLYESEQFEVFLHKFLVLAREFFLPPEKHKFALVCERSLFPMLNIEEPASWLMTVYFAGCPSCSKFTKDADHLRTILKAQVSPVLELGDDTLVDEAALPVERPSVLLFVDRSSDSMQIRRESQEALNIFREFALQTEMLNQINGQPSIRPERSSVKTQIASLSTPKHPRLHSFSSTRNIIIGDKVSLVMMNEGQQVTLENFVPNLQGSTVHEILSYALKQKELKLSTIAKNAGFQLLSKDFDIEVVESLPSQGMDQSDQVLGETPAEHMMESSDLDVNQLSGTDSSREHGKLRNSLDVEQIMLESKEDSLEKSSSASPEPNPNRNSVGTHENAEDGKAREMRFSGIPENEQEKYFIGSFYFVDGQYRLLETLTGGVQVPSVVIVDPISEEHYVLAEHPVLNHPLLSMFVNNFLTRQLPPYIQSAAEVSNSPHGQQPPFVNRDFHDKDSIPLVTGHTFAVSVLGNASDPKSSGNSWDRDVLVLFSNSWCGFCQRMELVVREVHRAVMAYANVKFSTRKEKVMTTGEYAEDVTSRLPLIYMMDCMRNDCSLITRPILQRNIYPLLLLFPARRKNETVNYEGKVAVGDIIKFLAGHGSSVVDLIMDKSILQDHKTVEKDPQIHSLHHEVVLKVRLENAVSEHQINSQLPFASQGKPQLSVGLVLVATEKLLNSQPYEESKILIVKADESAGFQGLITNKPIRWDSLEDLEQGFELLKTAPLLLGGPVMLRGMPLVALTLKSIEGKSIEVLPNIHFMDQLNTLNLLEEIRVGNQFTHDFWFFLGYSGWGWEQLFLEIGRGEWHVRQGNLELLELP